MRCASGSARIIKVPSINFCITHKEVNQSVFIFVLEAIEEFFIFVCVMYLCIMQKSVLRSQNSIRKREKERHDISKCFTNTMTNVSSNLNCTAYQSFFILTQN